MIIPLIPRTLDFQASGLVGRGLGRYTSSGLPDATVNGNGQFKALGAADALIGVTYHVTPSIDLWAFGGFEQVNRNFTTNAAGVQVGYGLTNGVNNAGCNNEGGTCAGQTHRIFQITGGMWDKLYKGNFGEVRVGVQYSYTQRQLFGATAAANGAATAASSVRFRQGRRTDGPHLVPLLSLPVAGIRSIRRPREVSRGRFA